MSERPEGRAVLTGFSAYVLWGVLVMFWPLLAHVPSLEVMAWRVVWALLLVVALLLVLRVPWTWLRDVRLEWRRITLASILVGINWLTFITAVNSGHGAETSLGYYLNPLVNVAVGMIAFRERPGKLALAGVGAAALGVLVVASQMATTVWIALLLAFSFSGYGAAKRGVKLPTLQGLAIESAILAPISVAYLVFAGTGAFTADGSTAALLIASGAVTALPLYLFSRAAPHLPFGVLGMLQYVAPTLMLFVTLFVFGQSVPPAYWAGIALVWLGFGLFMVSVLGKRRRARSGTDAAA